MYGGGGSSQSGGSSDDALAYMAAMAAMAEQERRARTYKYLEGLLPLILLLILGGFIAYKAGWLSLPGLFGMQREISVIVLTDQPEHRDVQELVSILQTREGGYLGVIAHATADYLDPETPYTADYLGNYDVVIIYQVENKVLTSSQRDELYKYISNGGNLIIVKDSGTCVPASEIYSSAASGQVVCNGWGGGLQYRLEEYIPVRCTASGGNFCQEEPVSNVRLYFMDPEHPISPTRDSPYYPSRNDRISRLYILKKIAPQGYGKPIARIQVMQGDEAPESYVAIIAAQIPFRGRVVYFNYDPQKTPIIFWRALLWASGYLG